MKVLFGIATVSDLDELHTAADELRKKEDAIVRSMNLHVNYFKQLDGTDNPT